MLGPMAARMFSGFAPKFSAMARTTFAPMACAVPRQPAWAAPTAPVAGSKNSSGVQSAVNTSSATPGVFVTRASHLG